MKVRFNLEPKVAKDGTTAIWCVVREYGHRFRINTKQRIKPEYWNKEICRANIRKAKDKIQKGELKSLNLFLSAYETKLFEIEREVRKDNFSAGFDEVVEAIKSRFLTKKKTFFDLYDDFIQIKSTDSSKALYSKHKRVRNLVEEFDKNLTFAKLKPYVFEKFFNFLTMEKGMLNNTAYKTFEFFKSFLIWSVSNGFTDNTSFKSFNVKNEKNEIIYLTEEELMRLYNLKLDNEKLARARDLFVFQCFTGVRYSDIKNMGHEDIKGATWYLRTQKTHQILEIPLNSFALSILAKYRDFPKPLPIISNQKQNDYIKELCKIAKIDSPVKIIRFRGSEREEKIYKKYEVISTHTARRTFISLSLQKGMKPDVIMAITGHSSYRMMQRYLKIADEQKRKEMDEVWGGTLHIVNN